ncbi:uncharacterized protein TNCV_4622621 [Trichonephila clavipes]|nr:uncharacterized protein TNCV_4622621 [Trichonephila clavipes]
MTPLMWCSILERGCKLRSRSRQYPSCCFIGRCYYNSLFTLVATVAEWSRYRIVADRVTSSSPVPLKTRLVGQRCTLNLLRAQTSSRLCGVVVRRGGASSQVSSTSLDNGLNYDIRHQKPSCS